MNIDKMKKSKEKVRVRFAPSPTGFLHIGGARTALFNWLFARHHKGVFVLRIEDTDRVRSTQKAIDEILNSMQWLGLDWDEGPFFQSERSGIYLKAVDNLLERGLACKAEETVNGGRAVLFKAPEQSIEVDDLVYGKMSFDMSLMEDLVLLRSDGSPTFNLACVVDDIEMGITHILRGDDHISNTPKQIALYRALGHKPPLFSHLPMILGEDEKPLSKRHGSVAVLQYKKDGFLPEALLNYLALLGWSPGGNRERMTIEELVKFFSIERINKKGAVFSEEKLLWLNGQAVRNMNEKEYLKLASSYLHQKYSVHMPLESCISNLLKMHKSRLKKISDIIEQTRYYFEEELIYDSEAVEKYLTDISIAENLSELGRRWSNISDFHADNLETELREYADQIQLKAGQIIHPLRVALTGKTASPGIFEVAEVLGKDRVLNRIENAELWVKNNY